VSAVAAVLLGIVQGLTEFLPVSSSAHLILARAFFGWEVPADFGLAFDVALHIGTLAAILWFFRPEIAAMVRSLPSLVSRAVDPAGRILQLIAVGTVPVVIVGLLLTTTSRTSCGRRGLPHGRWRLAPWRCLPPSAQDRGAGPKIR
jgi:undecaprenyl-diphosphatase